MKFYTLDQSIPSWILEHRCEIYQDILEQCEEELKKPNTVKKIDVALLRTKSGVTKFVIKDYAGIIESLKKAMNYFVEVEKYEFAARARDCIKGWEDFEINNICQ